MVKITEKRICDCCGQEAKTQFYQFKVKRFLRTFLEKEWLPKDIPETWDMCEDCLTEICIKVKERRKESNHE